MTVKDIVAAYLTDYGYDGLFSDRFDCACRLSDLMPCEEYLADCEPGYLGKCERGSETECEACANGGWHIQREKPAEESR